jgi:hypothetical protein
MLRGVKILKGHGRMTAADREAVWAYLRERLRVWKPEEQEPYSKCADIMVYYQQFKTSPEIVRSWIRPATRYLQQCAKNWLERHNELTYPEHAEEVHRLWDEYFRFKARWAQEMDTLVALRMAGTPVSDRIEAGNVSRLYKKHKQAAARAERAQNALIRRFALASD